MNDESPKDAGSGDPPPDDIAATPDPATEAAAASTPADGEALARMIFERSPDDFAAGRNLSVFGRIAAFGFDEQRQAPAFLALYREALPALLALVVKSAADKAVAAHAIDVYATDVLARAPGDAAGRAEVAHIAAEAGVSGSLALETAWILGPALAGGLARLGGSPPTQADGAQAEGAQTGDDAITPRGAGMSDDEATDDDPKDGEAKPANDATPADADPFALLTRAPENRQPPPEGPAEGDGGRGAAPPTDGGGDGGRGEGQKASKDPDTTTQVVDYAVLRDLCLEDKAQGRKIILVVGLATTGKTFLVQRLIDLMSDDYGITAHKGIPDIGDGEIGRTKEILRHCFSEAGKKTSPKNFTIFDLPGDMFVELVRNGYVVSPDDKAARLVYTIFAFVDAVIFVEPALQVLMADHYLAQGDQLELKPEERRLRIDELRYFIRAMRPLTQIISLLRDGMKTALGRGKTGNAERAAALDAVVERTLKITDPEAAAARLKKNSLKLPMPGLLLLSRADELQAQIEDPDGRAVFDHDPALELLVRQKPHFKHLAASFETFSVDLITAAEGHKQDTPFIPADEPHLGVDRVIDGWLMPAIRHCQPPWWRRPFHWLGAPQSPGMAIWWRRLLDPEFGKWWKERA